MLATNLPILKQQLNKLIETPPTSESPMYKAAYDAYFNVTNVEIDVENEDNDVKQIIAESKESCEQKVKDDAKQFATDFCNALKDGKFMDTIADEIDKHIKAAQIDITVAPTAIATIISPMGPCSGACVISESTGSQIIIS